ncbi:molybdate transporter 1-like [Forsythia ovata]|uniref:Molybdate transporter 1-like n=1 Tax=Forsythia ovata TaxID=205694 RepID=A0ABD1QCX1_9LAMI
MFNVRIWDIGCWFGATPCCHGAGGLAVQYKFGGRSGWCMALLGIAKLVLGLVLGSSLVKILDQFLVGVLGVLLLFAGIELTICSRDMNSKEESVVMFICTLFHLLAQVQYLDFFVGLLCICFLGQKDWVMSNLVLQLSAIICRSNVELELYQCWSVYMDDMFDEFL